jgi:hypothetical protein
MNLDSIMKVYNFHTLLLNLVTYLLCNDHILSLVFISISRSHKVEKPFQKWQIPREWESFSLQRKSAVCGKTYVVSLHFS